MKRLLFILSMLLGVAYGQICADEDTVRSNSVSLITYNSARINGTTSHFSGAVSSLQLKYVRVGQTDTVTSSGSSALRNITGLQANTQYVYYYKTICGSGSQSQTIGSYKFTTLANNVIYTPMDATGYQFKYLKVDTLLQFVPGDTSVSRGGTTNAAIKYKSSDNTFYGYYPSCNCWRALAIDSAGIISLLNGKVDSVTVSGDSLFYWKQGVSYGYILPALNSVWRNTGNSGIDTSVNWLGTNDNKDLVIKTNNNRRLTVNVNGAMGIGDPPDYGTSGYLLKTNGSGSGASWVDHSTLSTPLSKISAAAASNSIDHGSYSQTWDWNGVTSGIGLILRINNTSAVSGQTVAAISTSGANASANRNTYGLAVENTHTGTNSGNNSIYSSASGGGNFNRAGWFSASGTATNNYGGYFSATGGTNNYSVFTGEGDVALNQVGGVTKIGLAGSVNGTLKMDGSTSGTVTIQPQAAAGTYNFNLPTTAGTSGYLLTSAGGGSSAMTWTDPASLGSGLAIGSTVTSATAGSVFFAGTGGKLQQKNSDFFYDSTNKRLGIGTNSPSTTIHATASGAVAKFVSTGYVQNTVEISDPDGYTYITNGQFKVGSVPFVMNANGSYITYQTGGVDRMRVTYAGDVGIGNTSPGEKLEVTGNVKASGKLIARNIIYRTLNASDADFTAAVGTAYVLPDAATTARTVTLPAGQDGDIIRFHLPLTPSNHWTFSTAVTLPDGSTYTNIDTYTNSVTTIQYDGANSVWRAVVNL